MGFVTAKQTGRCTTFQVIGNLAGELVTDLEKRWHLATGKKQQAMRIDLRAAKQIDESGKHLLCEMFGEGIELVVPVRNREETHDGSSL